MIMVAWGGGDSRRLMKINEQSVVGFTKCNFSECLQTSLK